MKKIRTLSILFEGRLHPAQVPGFRGAVASKAGLEHIHFHNHLSEDYYLNGYPVIQYKSLRGKPSLVCVDYGVDEVHHLFSAADRQIQIGETTLDLKIEKLSITNYTLSVWQHFFQYRLVNWLPLSQKNYQAYKLLQQEHEKVTALQRILIGNILSFAKGVKWQIDKPIEVQILEYAPPRLLPFKGQKLMAFNVVFKTNVGLPKYIGLGKAASHGFGILYPMNTKKQNIVADEIS